MEGRQTDGGVDKRVMHMSIAMPKAENVYDAMGSNLYSSMTIANITHPPLLSVVLD